jgi:nucleolar protein 15
MKAYFSQFGKVTRLRVSRNKKTGAPKHYAFVEFASAEVAEIVAKTMDKYLMFGHILQCSVIPDEQVHPNLFVGANQRFKKMPRNKIAGAEMMRGAERAVWEKRVAHEKKRRSLKEKILKEKLGYDYEAPTLKAVEDVPKKATGLEGAPAQQLLTEAQAVEETTPKPIEELKAAHNDAENPKPKKSMKAGKRKADAEADTLDAAQVHDVEAKAPKSKKAKAAAVEPEQVEGVKEKKKAKKEAKKAPVEEITKEKKRKSLGSDDINGSKAKKTKKAKA